MAGAKSAKKRTRRRGDTALVKGDLLMWATSHGNVLAWVVEVLRQSGGTVPLLEVLEGLHRAPPTRLDRLRAAPGPVHRRGRLWYVVTDLRDAEDPDGRYTRVDTGFERAGFVPSPDSKHGLLSPWVDVARLAVDLEEIARSSTAEGKAEAVEAARRSRGEAAERERARVGARTKAKALLARRVEPWQMPKPREAGSRRFVLSLSGKESHAIWFPPGVGNMEIGPRPPARRDTPHVVVGENEALFWDSLDALPKTGGGSAMPRWLAYEGADVGLFAWLARRESPLESLTFTPTTAIDVDARGARIGDLLIDTALRVDVKLVLGQGVRARVRGDAGHVTLVDTSGHPIAPEIEGARARDPELFSGWSVTKRGLGIANAALATLRRELRNLPKADAKKARPLVHAFVDALNALHGTKNNALLTAEREDVATAIEQLFGTPALAPLADAARDWFDARRDF